MKQKKIPARMCLGCHESRDKRDLLRVVKTKDGEIFLDKTGKANGRGAYICNNPACLDKAMKSNRLARSLGTQIPEEVYEQLRQAMEQ